MPAPRRSALAALLAAVLTACGSPDAVVDAVPADAAPPETATPAGTTAPEATGPRAVAPELPAGWRRESFRDVQLAVPGDWTWINGSQRVYQWCISDGKATGIGRPGAATLVGCFGEGDAVSPGTLIAENGTFVALDHAEFAEAGTVGDRETVHVGDVAVLVQAEPALRGRILTTVHTIEVDANGCPVRDGVTGNPGVVPSPAVGLGELTGVRSVAACLYELDTDGRRLAGPSLTSSLRLTGRTAAEALAALADAPAAGGQDRPEGCREKYGGEIVVLLVESAAGPSRVHIRFSGCDHNAVDDGVSPRRLTLAVRPFFTGPT